MGRSESRELIEAPGLKLGSTGAFTAMIALNISSIRSGHSMAATVVFGPEMNNVNNKNYPLMHNTGGTVQTGTREVDRPQQRVTRYNGLAVRRVKWARFRLCWCN